MNWTKILLDQVKLRIGGFGGIIKSRAKQTLLIFYGPCVVSNSLQAGLKTILYVWNTWKASKWKEKYLVICTDSKTMVNEYEISW